jgi:hypothetical protein
MKTGRNDPCPCGSGKKYKKCCARKSEGGPSGLQGGIRMKGGVGLDSHSEKFRAIVHSWNNVDCIGEPTEWQSDESFDSEDDAMSFYKRTIRPKLERLMREASAKDRKINTSVTRLE